MRPLLAKEMREIAGGRALWIMLLLLCGLVGFSFLQAAELYGEASSSARESPVLAGSLSPLDGILVPTLGAFYIGVTLLLSIHQMTDAERVCDRFVLLADGTVRGAGTLEELRSRTALPAGRLEDIFLALT